MGMHIGQRPNELMPVHLETLSLGQLLRRRVRGDGLVENLQHIVHILLGMGNSEGAMVDAGQCEHESNQGMSVSVEAGLGSQVERVVLKSLLYVERESAS